MGVVVVGQAGRDLVLRLRFLPEAGGSAPILERRELLGGKGANQAVGLAQLGVQVALVAVVGQDDVGGQVLAQANGVDVAQVIRRGQTALIVDVVEQGGVRRLLEHVPAEALLTCDDLERAGALIGAADTVCLQLQQLREVVLQAARTAAHGALVVLDGAPDDDDGELLRRADVLRMDGRETELVLGEPVAFVRDARQAAGRLLLRGPGLVALAVPGQGDLVAWEDGSVLLPLADEVVDPTGGGDAFVAGLVAALRAGAAPEAAARRAFAAAASTVARLGGRPGLRT